MVETILTPIGREQGIIEESIEIKLVFDFKRQSIKQKGFYKKPQLPIHGRSPPLFDYR
jgi:hypothetical protein